MKKDTMERNNNKRIKAENHKIVKNLYPMKEDIVIKASIYNDAYRLHMDQLDKAFPWSSSVPVTMNKTQYAQACALDVCLLTGRLYDSIRKSTRRAEWQYDEPDWEEE